MEISETLKLIKKSRISKEELFVVNYLMNSRKIKTFWKSDYILYRKNHKNILFIDTKNKKLYLNYCIGFYEFQDLNKKVLFNKISEYIGIDLSLGKYIHETCSGENYEHEHKKFIFKCYYDEIKNKLLIKIKNI